MVEARGYLIICVECGEALRAAIDVTGYNRDKVSNLKYRLLTGGISITVLGKCDLLSFVMQVDSVDQVWPNSSLCNTGSGIEVFVEHCRHT